MRRRALAALALLLAVPAQVHGQSNGPMVPLMGKRLFALGGEELGRVVDVIADADGLMLAVVVDVGGFMGLGSRRVALSWVMLRFRPDADRVRLSVDVAADRVAAAPEYRRGELATIFRPPAP